ncbi:hypothetical protein ASF54_14330 [Frondihabitans sp. Leaf304]|nr:hypothetical protein ASF54_14330 [Frondihabitans sp. Leaf304]
MVWPPQGLEADKAADPQKMTPERVAEARHLYEARSKTVTEIANLFGVSRPTVYRVLGDTSGQAL